MRTRDLIFKHTPVPENRGRVVLRLAPGVFLDLSPRFYVIAVMLLAVVIGFFAWVGRGGESGLIAGISVLITGTYFGFFLNGLATRALAKGESDQER